MINLKPSRNFLEDLRDNELAALWMLVGSRRAFAYVTPSALQFGLLAIMAALANTLFSWVSVSGQGQFNLQGLISYLLWPFIALITGIFLAQRQGLGRLILVPAVLWLAGDINIVLIQSLLQFLGQTGRLPTWSYAMMGTLFALLFIWQTLAVMWIFARELKWPWWERGLIFAGTVMILAIWQGAMDTQPIWKVDEQAPRLPEAALYAQPRLLDEQLSQMQQGVLGETNWYFVGVGGAGYQDVFRFEVEQTQRQFDTRFGTLGRSIGLFNHPQTQDSAPMATKTSLERTLARVGQQMNPDEDVLFLFMTSHGLPNIFELSNEPIALDSIDPTWLRQALDRSGIRWRVLVVSACYSGSFIEALRSPDTMVITASAADKTSFGCTNAPEYTYFGRAFFAEAMRNESSLAAAFDTATERIRQMEQDGGYDASEPQMVVGRNIALMLPRFESYLFPPPVAALHPLDSAQPMIQGAFQ
ncbi:MAG: C13 family peptidase [Pseudomonadota bacterium]|nr:C13 family peptidase [Pseudomonadota bacterium]